MVLGKKTKGTVEKPFKDRLLRVLPKIGKENPPKDKAGIGQQRRLISVWFCSRNGGAGCCQS